MLLLCVAVAARAAAGAAFAGELLWHVALARLIACVFVICVGCAEAVVGRGKVLRA